MTIILAQELGMFNDEIRYYSDSRIQTNLEATGCKRIVQALSYPRRVGGRLQLAESRF